LGRKSHPQAGGVLASEGSRSWKRWWFWPPTLALVALLSLGAICHHYHVYSMDGWRVYEAMDQECHPAWRDYNFRRVAAGDSVDEVIRITNPTKVERQDRWVILKYHEPGFTGVTAVAFDGRMVLACAWSCGWNRLFFDEMTEEQSMEFLGRSKDDPRRFGIVPVYR
jgi:hypothetical protein